MPEHTYPFTLRSRYGHVKIYYTVDHGKFRRYEVIWKHGKKDFRERTPDEARAHKIAERALRSLEEGGGYLTDKDIQELTYYRACESALRGKCDLMEAVQWYLKTHATTTDVTCKHGAEMYIGHLVERKYTLSYIYSVRSRVQSFVRFTLETGVKMMSEINAELAARFIGGLNSDVSKAEYRRVLSAWLLWCRKNGYFVATGAMPFDTVTIPRSERHDPVIYTPEELEALLRYLEQKAPHTVLVAAIGAFSGLRGAEITRLKDEDIDRTEWVIRLSSSITKTRRRRMVAIPENLRAWIAQYPILPEMSLERCRADMRKALLDGGVELKKNGFRHSFATYACALHENPSYVADQCGHSLDVLQTHYKGLGTKEAAVRWFSIMPSELTA